MAHYDGAVSGRAAATIAIPAMHDDPEVFGRVLDLALAASEHERVVVVDMSQNDALAQVCATKGHRVQHHAFPESGGVSHSRNRCVELSDTRHVVFLDSDAFVEPGWIDALFECLGEDRVAVAGSRVVAEWEGRPGRLLQTTTASDWLSLFDFGERPVDVPRIMGTSYAIDRDRVADPPFDETLGRRPGWPLAMEENALCEWSRARGWRVVYQPRSVVRHRIPAERSTWRWMWQRAHTAGRETRIAGRFEPMPERALGLEDRLFQATVALPFLAGVVAGRGKR